MPSLIDLIAPEQLTAQQAFEKTMERRDIYMNSIISNADKTIDRAINNSEFSTRIECRRDFVTDIQSHYMSKGYKVSINENKEMIISWDLRPVPILRQGGFGGIESNGFNFGEGFGFGSPQSNQAPHTFG
jgi:hypothetical protein